MDTITSILTSIIVVILGILCLLVRQMTRKNYTTKRTIIMIAGIMCFIVGFGWIGLTICCNTIGTTTTESENIAIYPIDEEYITWTGESNNTPNVYIAGENGAYIKKSLASATYTYCNEGEEPYYTRIRNHKKFLFLEIVDNDYIIHVPK